MTAAARALLTRLADTWRDQARHYDQMVIRLHGEGATQPYDQQMGQAMKAQTCAAELLAHLAQIPAEPPLDKQVFDGAMYRAETAEARLDGALEEIDRLREALRRWMQAGKAGTR